MSFSIKMIVTEIVQKRFVQNWWLGMVLLLMPSPGLAQTSNFGTLTLSSTQTVGNLSGTTGGSTSLPAITSKTDHNNNRCLGFGDPTPDHVLVLKQPVQNLTLQITSGASDTTLVVQGPDGLMRCADNLASRKPTTIRDTEWQAGSYRIWVGTATPGVRRDYMLTIRH